jgi:hypothetical protein
MEQLQDNLGALGWTLSEEEMNELDKVNYYGNVKLYHIRFFGFASFDTIQFSKF